MIWRTLLGCLFGYATVAALSAQSTFTYGLVENNRYKAPSGEYVITLPIQPELGGRITDTPEVVTFQDNVGLHASIACFGLDLVQRRDEETKGRRDYLIWFFGQHVQRQFRERFDGASIESARFIPELLDGALLVYNLLPGGSMFNERVPTGQDGAAPVAKRGNLLFLHHHHLYVVSIELAEKVLDPSSFSLSVAEQDEVLRKRLLELVGRMSFNPPLA